MYIYSRLVLVKTLFFDITHVLLALAGNNEPVRVTPSTFSGQYRYMISGGPALTIESDGFLRFVLVLYEVKRGCKSSFTLIVPQYGLFISPNSSNKKFDISLIVLCICVIMF